MAQSVSTNDYDWFTPVDLTRVINAIHALPDWTSVVLVGGQSLTAWVEYYKIKLPTFDGPYLTIDADFLGTKAEAEVIARELGSHARITSIDDQTPNAAVIDFTGASGKKLHIDILSGVLGLKSDVVRKLAVNLEIDSNQPVRVLHPLLVLESRCINLERLSGKRQSNGMVEGQILKLKDGSQAARPLLRPVSTGVGRVRLHIGGGLAYGCQLRLTTTGSALVVVARSSAMRSAVRQ